MACLRRTGILTSVILLAGSLLAGNLRAQTPASTPTPDVADPPVQHKGQIVIQSHGEPPPSAGTPDRVPDQNAEEKPPPADAKADVSDAEREAVDITAYDLDVRLDLQRSGLSMRAIVTVRNSGATPLRQVPLQVSSSLRWESATLLDGAHRLALPVVQHRLDTDADHTGAASEAVVSLPEPLAPQASASLDLFLAGRLAVDGGRLARLGASTNQQNAADWDGISPSWTGLRGFGDVLWYPVASPQFFLSDGNTLFTAVGRKRQHGQDTSVRLRLSVEYTGEPPVAAYFCGRRAALKAVPDDPSSPIATGSGVATAEFPAEPLGFRVPSLFVIQQKEILLGGGASSPVVDAARDGTSSSNPEAAASSPAPVPQSSADGTVGPPETQDPVLALVSTENGTAVGLGAAAEHAATLLVDWLGPRPLSAVTLLDHPGQPFQDGPLLVAPAATLQTSPEAPALVYSLSHGWIQTGQPWMDEGLAQFFALLWVERESGRTAAVSQLADLMQPVALEEPEFTSAADSTPGEPIVSSANDLFYRRKAAAVWWMLRDVAGEKALRSALSTWRVQPISHSSPERQAIDFEHLLERQTGNDLGWFFADWVLRDRGLPDLTLANVETSQTPAGPGHNTGFLVAVTVKNEGGAIADVPVIVRSGQFSTTQRMRIPGFAQATQRVLVESEPTEVQVNDGGTPELRSAIHTRHLGVRPKP